MSFSLGERRVTVSFLFPALLAFLLFCDVRGAALSGLAAAALHEAGLLAAMLCLGVPVKEIRFAPFGVELVRGDERQESYLGDALVSAAGPCVNLSLFLTCLAAGQEETPFALANLLLGAMNLLPIESLDGGQLLYAALSRFAGPQRAGRAVALLSFLVLVPLAACAFLLLFRSKNNISLLLAVGYLGGLLLKRGRY